MNFSTWPPVSTRRCSPVKNGWHFEQMSRRSSFWVEWRSEEHTSELQSQSNLVCRLLLEKKTQRLEHVVDEVGRGELVDRGVDLELHREGRVRLLLRDDAVLHHGRQHVVLPPLGRGQVDQGVV